MNPVPMPNSVIQLVNELGEADGMKSIYFHTKHHTLIWDSSLIAGVDYELPDEDEAVGDETYWEDPDFDEGDIDLEYDTDEDEGDTDSKSKSEAEDDDDDPVANPEPAEAPQEHHQEHEDESPEHPESQQEHP